MIRFPIVNLKNSLGLMFDKQEENQMTYVRIGGSSFSNEDIFASAAKTVVFCGLLYADCRLDDFIDCHRKTSVHSI